MPVWVPVLAVVFVAAGAVSGVPAGILGLLSGLGSLGYIGLRVARARVSTTWQREVGASSEQARA